MTDKKKRGNVKMLNGVIVSDKMKKTVIVEVERLVKHSIYKKYIRTCNKFVAHDENNNCRLGDSVLIYQSRPMSRTKRWRVTKILKRINN